MMSGGKNKRKRRADRQPKQEASLQQQQQQQQGETVSIPSSKKKARKKDHLPNTTTTKQKEGMDQCFYFQDVIQQYTTQNDNPNENDISNAFFELANAPLVGFRINDNSNSIIVQQDVAACGKHTGGIVWETAYLLLQYLLAPQQPQTQTLPQTQPKKLLGKTLEVGAGCGMVGQVLAARQLCESMIMTETHDVMENLRNNVARNNNNNKVPIHVLELDWKHVERDVQRANTTTTTTKVLKPHSCDTIVGTDVVFTPKLVEPLWSTLHYMSHSNTNIYLCLQERCAASHQLLLEKASFYQFQINDITDRLHDIPSCQWGQSLECRLFHITPASDFSC